MCTLAYREDPDEMQLNPALYQGLHYMLKLKPPLWTEIHHNLENSTRDPFRNNGQSHTYCINMYGKIHQNTKG